jgi:hypothetical protein
MAASLRHTHVISGALCGRHRSSVQGGPSGPGIFVMEGFWWAWRCGGWGLVFAMGSFQG